MLNANIIGNNRNSYLIPGQPSHFGQLSGFTPGPFFPTDGIWHRAGLHYLVLGSASIQVYNFNPNNGLFTAGQLFAGGGSKMAFNPAGDALAVVRGHSLSIFRFNHLLANPLSDAVTVGDSPALSMAGHVCFSPCGDYIAVANNDNFTTNINLSIWQYTRPAILTRVAINTHTGWVERFAVDWSNRDVITISGLQLGMQSYTFDRVNNSLTLFSWLDGTWRHEGLTFDFTGEFLVGSNPTWNLINIFQHTPGVMTHVSSVGFPSSILIITGGTAVNWDSTGNFIFCQNALAGGANAVIRFNRSNFGAVIMYGVNHQTLDVSINPQNNRITYLGSLSWELLRTRQWTPEIFF